MNRVDEPTEALFRAAKRSCTARVGYEPNFLGRVRRPPRVTVRVTGLLAAMSSSTPDGSGSMESAKEDGPLALEDARPEPVEVDPGALVVALGPPTTYGPQRREDRRRDGKGQGSGGGQALDINPFWSQTLKR